ncbi:MAG: FHA domain-containing protein [Acidobacteria bacterium]|nr:FHA domain-containing protein [Acidobacteriota bacterium]
MRAKLQVTNLTSKEMVLEKFLPPEIDIITIGRHPSSYIYLTSAHVSKEHALIIHENDIFFLVDKSSNGTLLNQVRIERDKRIKLKNGDIITTGEYQAVFALEEDQVIEPEPAKAIPQKTSSITAPVAKGGRIAAGGAISSTPTEESFDSDSLLDDDTSNTFSAPPTSFQDVILGLEPGEESSYLVIVGGKRDGQRVELRGSTSEVYIGRGQNCQLQVEHPSISSNHAKIRMDWAGITVYDLNSQTGVFINGVRISSSRKLHNGDEISFGIPTNMGGVKLILYDRNSISSEHWIGVPPPVNTKTNEKVADKVEAKEENKDKGKAEEKPKSATVVTDVKPSQAKEEKTENKAPETPNTPEDKAVETLKNAKAAMPDMNRVVYAGLTVRDMIFVGVLLIFMLGFIIVGLSFL